MDGWMDEGGYANVLALEAAGWKRVDGGGRGALSFMAQAANTASTGLEADQRRSHTRDTAIRLLLS